MNIKIAFLGIVTFFLSLSLLAQKKDRTLQTESQQIIQQFKQKDPGIKKFFHSAYGYAVFPHIGKGGLGIGGAGGKGIVYKKGNPAGTAKMTQVTIGLQAGGQKYAEVIFFQNQKAYDRFTGSKYEFAAQVSAVALKSGVSEDAQYSDGMLVFTMALGGLMYEATIGGQKFKVSLY